MPVVTQLVKKSPACYEILRFIAVFIRSCHWWSHSWTRCSRSITSHCFFKIHSNIILPSTPRSSELSSLHVFQLKFLCISLSPVRTARFANLILYDLITLIIFGMLYELLSSLLCIFLYASVSYTLFVQNILISTLLSVIFNPCSFLRLTLGFLYVATSSSDDI